MDVIKSRYGLDRSIEKLGDDRIRIMGESIEPRIAENNNREITMFDFEGGPCYNVGGTIRYQKTNRKIKKITIEKPKYEGLTSIVLDVEF